MEQREHTEKPAYSVPCGSIQTAIYTLKEGSFHVSSYRLKEGLSLVKAIKVFVFHHQEMSSIDDYPLQTDE